MENLFYFSSFNGDISKWNTSNVTNMSEMFSYSNFNGDISNWKPISLKDKDYIFERCPLQNNQPYWATVEIEFLPQAIKIYELNEKLHTDLPTQDKKSVIMKV